MSFNRNDDADLLALQTEVLTDPLAIGYDPTGNVDQTILALINAKNYSVEKPMISGASVRTVVTRAGYDGASIDNQEWLRWITGSSSLGEEDIAVTDDIKQQLAGIPTANGSIWSAATRAEMNAALAGLINVAGSRAEVLFGYGTVLSREDWFAARDYTP